MYAVRPETEKADVQGQREERNEDLEEPHCRLDEEEEHAEYADHEMVLRVAKGCQCWYAT